MLVEREEGNMCWLEQQLVEGREKIGDGKGEGRVHKEIQAIPSLYH